MSRVGRFDWERALMASELISTARLTGFAAATHSGRDGGGIYASQRTLATETGLNPKTVRKGLAALVSAGFLVETRSATRTRPAEYRLSLPEGGVASTPQVGYSVDHPAKEVGYSVDHPAKEVGYSVDHPPSGKPAEEVEVGYSVDQGGVLSTPQVGYSVDQGGVLSTYQQTINTPSNRPVTPGSLAGSSPSGDAAADQETPMPSPPPPGVAAIRLPGSGPFGAWLVSNGDKVLEGDSAPEGYSWGYDDEGTLGLLAVDTTAVEPEQRRKSRYAYSG